MNSIRQRFRSLPSVFLALTSLILSASMAVAQSTFTYKIAECDGAEADPDRVSINVQPAAPGDQILRDLIRIKHINVRNAERISKRAEDFQYTCVPVAEVVNQLATGSGALAKSESDGSFRIIAIRNGQGIQSLRVDANKYTDPKDKAKLKRVLRHIIALAQPGDKGEAQADVTDEYAQLGNLAMADKEYVTAEKYYRTELALVAKDNEESRALVLSNVADARAYQDDIAGSKKLYQDALALMEAHPSPLTLPNSVVVLETLSNAAVTEKRFEDAAVFADRAYDRLGDPGRSKWDASRLEHALEFGGEAEEEFGRLLADGADYAAAGIHYERALKLTQERYGQDSEKTDSLRQWVILYAEFNGKTQQVSEHAEEQIASSDKRGDQTSEAYVDSLYHLLAAYGSQERTDRVIATWLRMLDARRALLGDANPRVVTALRDLATLYRIDRKWAQASATDHQATAIKLSEDDAAISKLPIPAQNAMRYDPGLPALCAQFQAQWQPLTDLPAPPQQRVPPGIVQYMPDSFKPGKPPPKEKLAQARLFEQVAECFPKSMIATHELERALLVRISEQGNAHPDTRTTADRLIELLEQSGDTQNAQRIRTLLTVPTDESTGLEGTWNAWVAAIGILAVLVVGSYLAVRTTAMGKSVLLLRCPRCAAMIPHNFVRLMDVSNLGFHRCSSCRAKLRFSSIVRSADLWCLTAFLVVGASTFFLLHSYCDACHKFFSEHPDNSPRIIIYMTFVVGMPVFFALARRVYIEHMQRSNMQADLLEVVS